MKRNCLKSTLFAALLLNGTYAFANEAEVAVEPAAAERDYFIVNQDVTDFLKDLGRDTRSRFQTSPKVRGRLQSAEFSGSVESIMNDVATRLDLDWFKYNSVIFVSDKSEALTRMIRLGDLSLQDAMTELDTSGLLFDEFPVTAAAEDTALLVTGPPQFLALVESVIEGIPSDIVVASARRTRNIVVRRGTAISLEAIK